MILVKFIRKILSDYRLFKGRKRALEYERKNLSFFSSQKLTKSEYSGLKNQWGRLGLKIYPDVYKIYKGCVEFDPRYLADDLYYPYMLGALNPRQYSVGLSHKAFYEIIFHDVKQPKTICKCIRGIFYDNHGNVISSTEAKEILERNMPFIIKPTVDASTGKNVMKITSSCDYSRIFKTIGEDFIAQEVIKQSKQTSVLNPSSLNTIRVSSLYLNGKFSIVSMVVRMGKKNSVVDNLGAGGLMLGIHDDGSFYDFAYDSKYAKSVDNDGVIFKGKGIDNIEVIKSFIEDLHVKHLPHMSFIGWDIALNKDDEPVLIEANLQWPSIQFTQLAVGRPVFAERTDEVIDYVVNFYNSKGKC